MSFLQKHKALLVYAATVLISALLIMGGALWARYTPPESDEVILSYQAVVESITDVKQESYQLSGEQGELLTTTIEFRARLLSQGNLKGLEITGYQQQDSLMAASPRDVKPGDQVVVSYLEAGDGDQWYFMDYYRSHVLVWLAVLFLVLLIFFGRIKGINTIISLGFTLLAVFLVFVPSVLSGKNIYFTASVTCLFCTLSTLLIVSGWSKKTLIAAAGCVGGLAVTALLTLLFSAAMNLSGLTDSNANYLATMNDISIDLRAVIFGAILVGALGAVMDVSMSLASSLREVSEQMGNRRSIPALFRSGMNIGKDMMGTMANTLILAYIGSSLSVVLLLVASSTSLSSLFNMEMIAVEVMQSLVGSMGILFTIPATSLLAAWIYTRKAKAA